MHDHLILDVGEDFAKFKRAVKPIIYSDFDDYAFETVKSILEYIHGASNGWDLLQEFADELEATAAEKNLPEEDVEILKNAALELGRAIFKHLQDIGAYDSEGQLGFKLHKILTNDIVLTPFTPEDLVAGDDDLDIDELEDPNKVAEQLDELDEANLYDTPEYGSDDEDE